jgi:hypothetical protein
MTTWNYRVVKSAHGLCLKEVYYNDAKEAELWTMVAMAPMGETLSELVSDLSHMLEACAKPILVEKGEKLVEYKGKKVLK